MTAMYTMDAAMRNGVQAGHVEHEELEITDEELRALKGRARRAVTMDRGQRVPDAYARFLDPTGPSGYESFLRGEHRR